MNLTVSHFVLGNCFWLFLQLKRNTIKKTTAVLGGMFFETDMLLKVTTVLFIFFRAHWCNLWHTNFLSPAAGFVSVVLVLAAFVVVICFDYFHLADRSFPGVFAAAWVLAVAVACFHPGPVAV